MSTDDGYPDEWPHPLYVRGHELLEEERFAAAAAALTAAVAAVDGAPIATAECLYWAAVAHAGADDPERALDALLDADEILDEYEPSEFSIECAESTALILEDLGRVADSVEFLRLAADGYAALGDRGGHADTEFRIGHALTEIGSAPEAVAAFEAAEYGFTAEGRTEDTARTYSSRGEIAIAAEDFATARAHFERARELFADDNRDAQLYCWYRLGLAGAGVGDFEAAVRELTTARDLAGTTGEPEAVAECEEALGCVLAAVGRYDDAIHSFTVAARDLPDEQALRRANCRNMAGLVLLKRGDADAAQQFWSRAREDYIAAGRADFAVRITVARGRALSDIARHDEALDEFRAAHTMSRSAGLNDEMAWCEAHIGAIHVARGEFATADPLLSRACAALVDGDRELYLTSRYFQALLYLERGDSDDARSALSEIRAAALELGKAELAADCATHLAVLMVRGGEHAMAVDLLDHARSALAELHEWPKVAICQSVRGMAQYALGDLRDAEDTLLDARAGLLRHGTVRNLADTDCHLGLVYLETGRTEEAEIALERARADIRALGGPPAHIAMVEANLAGVYTRQERYVEAARLFAAAEPVLAAAGQTRFAAMCRHNLGILQVSTDDIDGGIDTLESSLDDIGTDPHARHLAASKALNIGLAHGGRGDFATALTHIARGRELFAESEAALDVARCDLVAAACMSFQFPADWRRIVDLALPASIYIDHQRLQFVHARTRAAWTERYEFTQEELFSWVARLDDPVLMAELVEVSVNSGTHVARPADSPARAEFLATLAADIAAEPGTGTDPYADPGLPTTAAPGTLTLVAGATMPMRPPPRLRLPGGPVALADYIDSAQRRYGPLDRTAEVPAW